MWLPSATLLLLFELEVVLTTRSTTKEEDCATYGLNCPGCGLYLAPSKSLGFGRGVIAGRDFIKEELIDNSPSITVPNEVVENIILHNYIYSSEDEQFGMINFGPAMMFNHKPLELKDVDHTW